MEKVDVLIVGAGPAGSSCGERIARKGFNVVIIDKRQSIGEPVQCAEYIPKLFLKELEIEKDFISNEISTMKTFINFEESHESQSPGYLIERRDFDRALALNAIRKDARLLIGAKAVGYDDGKVRVNTKNGSLLFHPRIIIGADGPLSYVGRWHDLRNFSFVSTYQVELPKKGDSRSTKVYFFRECPGGYGWIFPKSKTFNVGIGVDIHFKKNPLHILDFFLEKLCLKKYKSIRISKGLIPTGGILDSLVEDNIILVGDAAGLTHAITGAGIPQAVISGKIAGNIVVKSLENNDKEILKEFDSAILEQWGDYVGTSAGKREYLRNNWKNDDFEGLIKVTWPAFKEYYAKDKDKG